MADRQRVIEGRRHGWFPIYKSATQRIREHFAEVEGLTIPTGLAVYGAIVELLNDARKYAGADEPMPRREIAERAGVGLKAASRYQDELETCGVIAVTRRQVEGVNLPNIITVVDELDYAGGSGPDDPTRGGETPGVGSSEPDGSGREDTLNQEELQETAPNGAVKEARRRALELVHPPSTKIAKAVKYRQQTVPPAIVDRARRLLSTFNAMTNRDIGAVKADGSPSPALTQIIGALLARPDIDVERWEAAIAKTVASPPSWVDGALQIGHVFGEKAAEWALAPADARRAGETDTVAAGDALIAEALRGRA